MTTKDQLSLDLAGSPDARKLVLQLVDGAGRASAPRAPDGLVSESLEDVAIEAVEWLLPGFLEAA